MNGSSDVARPAGRTESYSSISTYLACPLRYRFRYVDRLPAEVQPAQFALGSGIHRAFEVFIRQRIDARHGEVAEPDIGTLCAAFDERIEASGCTSDEIERFRAQGRPMLERFAADESESRTEAIGVEMGFGVDVPMPHDIPVRFVGYIDRIDRAAGNIELIDYKVAPIRPQAQVDEDLQLTAYAFALTRGALSDPETGMPLEAASRLGLSFVEDGVIVWTTRSEAQLSAFEERLKRVVGSIRAGMFVADPRPGRCRWCEYNATCEARAVDHAR